MESNITNERINVLLLETGKMGRMVEIEDSLDAMQELVGDCAARAKRALFALDIEPGTVDAFKAYVACLQCMYQLGMAVQLKSMGYHMEKL